MGTHIFGEPGEAVPQVDPDDIKHAWEIQRNEKWSFELLEPSLSDSDGAWIIGHSLAVFLPKLSYLSLRSAWMILAMPGKSLALRVNPRCDLHTTLESSGDVLPYVERV